MYSPDKSDSNSRATTILSPDTMLEYDFVSPVALETVSMNARPETLNRGAKSYVCEKLDPKYPTIDHATVGFEDVLTFGPSNEYWPVKFDPLYALVNACVFADTDVAFTNPRESPRKA